MQTSREAGRGRSLHISCSRAALQRSQVWDMLPSMHKEPKRMLSHGSLEQVRQLLMGCMEPRRLNPRSSPDQSCIAGLVVGSADSRLVMHHFKLFLTQQLSRSLVELIWSGVVPYSLLPHIPDQMTETGLRDS